MEPGQAARFDVQKLDREAADRLYDSLHADPAVTPEQREEAIRGAFATLIAAAHAHKRMTTDVQKAEERQRDHAVRRAVLERNQFHALVWLLLRRSGGRVEFSAEQLKSGAGQHFRVGEVPGGVSFEAVEGQTVEAVERPPLILPR